MKAKMTNKLISSWQHQLNIVQHYSIKQFSRRRLEISKYKMRQGSYLRRNVDQDCNQMWCTLLNRNTLIEIVKIDRNSWSHRINKSKNRRNQNKNDHRKKLIVKCLFLSSVDRNTSLISSYILRQLKVSSKTPNSTHFTINSNRWQRLQIKTGENDRIWRRKMMTQGQLNTSYSCVGWLRWRSISEWLKWNGGC